jgi:hypothetical protein
MRLPEKQEEQKYRSFTSFGKEGKVKIFDKNRSVDDFWNTIKNFLKSSQPRGRPFRILSVTLFQVQMH